MQEQEQKPRWLVVYFERDEDGSMMEEEKNDLPNAADPEIQFIEDTMRNKFYIQDPPCGWKEVDLECAENYTPERRESRRRHYHEITSENRGPRVPREHLRQAVSR